RTVLDMRKIMRARRWLFVGLILSVLPATSLAADHDGRLSEAARNRDTNAVRSLLRQRVDVNAPAPDGATARHWAVYWADADMANLLLRAGAKVDAANDYGVTPLALACLNGDARIVGLLLEAGANPNIALASGETPLLRASRVGSVESVKALLA